MRLAPACIKNVRQSIYFRSNAVHVFQIIIVADKMWVGHLKIILYVLFKI